MQFCEKCAISVVGSHAVCPLCQGQLSGTAQPQADPFPRIDTILKRHNLLLRILFFISAVLLVLCFAANYLFRYPGFWSLFVAVGTVCMWVTVSIVLHQRHNIPKIIVWQAVLFSIFALLIDFLTDWHRWSLDYAIPCFFMMAILVMWAVAGILRLRTEDFLVYLLIDLLYGTVPVAFLAFNLVHVKLPSVLCTVASIISLIALLTFKNTALKTEFAKRLHL